jgi:hypothetical protein
MTRFSKSAAIVTTAFADSKGFEAGSEINEPPTNLVL